MPATNANDPAPVTPLPVAPDTVRRPGVKPPGAAEAVAVAQGKLHTATLENLERLNVQLWDSDEEFEEFLAYLRSCRQREADRCPAD